MKMFVNVRKAVYACRQKNNLIQLFNLIGIFNHLLDLKKNIVQVSTFVFIIPLDKSFYHHGNNKIIIYITKRKVSARSSRSCERQKLLTRELFYLYSCNVCIQEETGKPLEWEKLGFTRVETFALSLADTVLRFEYKGSSEYTMFNIHSTTPWPYLFLCVFSYSTLILKCMEF